MRNLTPGRIYSAAIALVVIGLLAASLPRYHAVVDDTTVREELPELPVASDAPIAAPPVVDVGGALGLPPAVGAVLVPAPLPPSTAPPSSGETEDPTPPCVAQEGFDALRDTLFTLDALTGGTLPSRSTARALAVALGCSTEELPLVAIAMLIEIGDGLPDPGIPADQVPLLFPHIDLPPALIEFVQPIRPAIDPVCGSVATAAALVILALGHYPVPVSTVGSQALFAALSVCGQVQKLGSAA